VRRFARSRVVRHKPQDKGIVFEILAPRAGKREITGDDSRGCPKCNPPVAAAVDNRKAPQ